MSRLSNGTWKTVLFASCLALVIFAVALALGVKTSTQGLQVLNKDSKEALLRQVENSPEQPLTVAGNTDCPLKVLQATVKEIPGSEFSKLTGKTTDLATVSSVPEVKLVNTSGKTITGFVLAVRHPDADRNRGLVRPKVSIAPGESYTVERKDFVSPERLTVADETGQTRQRLVQPKMDDEKYWVQFAQRSDVLVFVGLVVFDDGSEWKVKKGREVR